MCLLGFLLLRYSVFNYFAAIPFFFSPAILVSLLFSVIPGLIFYCHSGLDPESRWLRNQY